MSKSNDTIAKKIITGIAISVGGTVITEGFKLIKNSVVPTINVGEWDNAYNNINKLIYKIDKDKYDKYRSPTTNNDWYELSCDTTYFIKLKDKNYIKVEAFKNKDEKKFYPEQRLKLSFIGNKKYIYRRQFLDDALKLTDEKHIQVKYLNDCGLTCDVIPHDFNKIVLDKNVKSRIINGLINWKNSKQWYEDHELVHKIGVFLYGKPGTGKSTIAKAISKMFNNAPILTIEPSNIMNSISGIFRMRKKYNGTIIVLIEDFDLYFKSREELENMELDYEQRKRKDANQNAIFQLLDGIYSTDNTIYIATTNFKDRIDPALIRYGRFDIQEELDYFNYDDALKCVKLLGYSKDVLDNFKLEYPVQPSYLQSMIMQYRSSLLVKGKLV
ncbi:MAG TPA: AAA family ATPase [Gallicola sp.]|nr:AAA family ATPase [Gallicola sp.]